MKKKVFELFSTLKNASLLFIIILPSVIKGQNNLPQMEVTKGNFTSFSLQYENKKMYETFNGKTLVNHPDYGKLPFNAEYPGYVEVLEKRSIDERYLVNAANPSKFIIQKALGALHYRVKDQWVTINHRIEDKGNGIFEASNQSDPVGFDMTKFASYIKTPQGQITFNNWKLYGSNENESPVLLASADWNRYTAGDDGIYVTDVFPGIDAQMVVNRGSVKTSFIVKKLNFKNYTTLLFKDEFKMPLTANFKFTGDYTNPLKAPSKVSLISGNISILQIGQAETFAENDRQNTRQIADYILENNRLVIAVPVKWIERYIEFSPFIIDPLVTSSNSLAQASITGSMYNAPVGLFCNLNNSCDYNLTVNTPPNTTLTDVKWSFNYLAQGACAMKDGAVRFTTGACVSPSNAAQYWFCNSALSGTCTGNNISIFNDVSSCLPAPSCAPVPVAFTMKFYRTCKGVVGCDNACIGAFSPWTMTLEGQTVAWTNVANPFSLSSTSMCGGVNVTATSNGVQWGVPTRTITWSFNSSGTPVVGTGSSATFTVPATAGTYTVYGTVTDACGITAVVSKTLTVLPTPVANAGSTKSLTCVQTTTVLSGGGGGTYAWSGPGTITNGTTANPTVNTPGIFTLVVTSGGCASPPATVAVIQDVNTPPVIATAGSLNCLVTTTTIAVSTTVSPVTYTWTGTGITGSTSSGTTTVNTGGTFNYTVTDSNNGCKTVGSVVVNQNTTIPTATAGTTGSITCTNNTINLTSGASGLSYTWTAPAGSSITGGANNQNTTGQGAGTYTVLVLNTANSCTNTATVAANVNQAIPTATAGTTGSITCATNTISLTSGASGLSYTWTAPGGSSITGGANNQNTTGQGAGTYTVNVLNSVNGCTNTATVAANVDQVIPTATAGTTGSITCTTNTINLTSGASGLSYTWTAPGGSSITGGANNQNTTGQGAGTYTVKVTNSVNGCTNTAAVAANVNQNIPAVTAGSTGSITCTTNTISLTSVASGASYTWTAPGGSSVNSPNSATTTANGGGTFSLNITNTINGCSNFTTVAVNTQTTKPVASIINTPTLTCSNQTVTLNGSPISGVTYTWTGGIISGSANNANVNVTGPGTYDLSVTFTSNGCTSIVPATVSITQNTTAPIVGPVGSNTVAAICNSTAALTGSASPAGSTPNWLGGVVSGGSTYTAAVSNPGTYTLVATNPANGCSAQTTFTLLSSGTAVSLSSLNGTVTCSTPSVQTIASTTSSPVSYNWSGPGIIGANNTATLAANLSGVYNLTVTNTSNNCTVSVTYNLAANNASVTPNAVTNNPTVTCSTPSATLSTSPSGAGPFTYSWSTGAGSSNIIVSPTVTTNYVVTVTNTANGCTGSQTVSVTADTTPPTGVSVSPNNFTITCSNITTTLTASATGASSYTWTAPGTGSIVSAGSSTAVIAGAGVYSLTATGSNGCVSAPVTATVTPDNNQPQVSLSNSSPSITCNNAFNSETLTVTNGTVSSYSWSPASGVSSPTSSTVMFTQSGTYTCVFTDSNNGCTNTVVVSVANATAAPLISTGVTPTITCTNSLVTIAPSYTPSSGLTYTWSGTGIVGSVSNSTVQVNQTGSYTLIAMNAVTGCSNNITVPVSGSNAVPTLTVTASSSTGINCLPGGSTVGLNAQSGSAGVTYTWSSGAQTQSISVSAGGVYTVTVQDNNSGCTTSSAIAVQSNTTAPTFTTASNNIPCGGGTSLINAGSTNTNVSYSWSGPGIVSGSNTASPQVNQAGTYSLTVTDLASGCSSSGIITVSGASITALAAADATTGTAPLNVNFTNQSTGASTYSWSFGNGSSSIQTNPSNVFSTVGTYTVVLIASNGSCSARDTLLIKVIEAFGPIPELFTPNGDNKNDVFFIPGMDGFPNSNLQIFNRWGSPIYSSKPYKNDWDGSPNSSGKTGSGKLPVGTYYYLLELGDKENSVYRGFVQIEY